MSKQIFISRSLKNDSPLLEVSAGHHLTAKSLIDFSGLPFTVPQADWIFFYSRKGVQYFFAQGTYQFYPFLWACLSEGTADELSKYITDISFIGEGSIDQIAHYYAQRVPTHEVTCFIRANESQDSIHKKLNRSKDFSIPVYDNRLIADIPLQDFDVLIFTSPLNTDAWFARRRYQSEKILAIGQTTANHLRRVHGIDRVIVADHPSEAAIAECLIKIL